MFRQPWIDSRLNRKFLLGNAMGIVLSSLVFLLLYLGMYEGQLADEPAPSQERATPWATATTPEDIGATAKKNDCECRCNGSGRELEGRMFGLRPPDCGRDEKKRSNGAQSGPDSQGQCARPLGHCPASTALGV